MCAGRGKEDRSEGAELGGDSLKEDVLKAGWWTQCGGTVGREERGRSKEREGKRRGRVERK